jgi:hypothetical protein
MPGEARQGCGEGAFRRVNRSTCSAGRLTLTARAGYQPAQGSTTQDQGNTGHGCNQRGEGNEHGLVSHVLAPTPARGLSCRRAPQRPAPASAGDSPASVRGQVRYHRLNAVGSCQEMITETAHRRPLQCRARCVPGHRQHSYQPSGVSPHRPPSGRVARILRQDTRGEGPMRSAVQQFIWVHLRNPLLRTTEHGFV